MTTNQFWGVSSFLCSVIPQLKVWNFPRHAGKWAVQNPPSHCAHPFQEIMCFFVFAYWFLETKTWLCWMSCFFSISYICSVYSVWDGWVSVSQTIVFLVPRTGLPTTAKASTQSPFNQPVKVENNEGVHSKCVACQSRGMGRIRKKLVGTVGGSSEIRGENHLGCTKTL